MRTIFAIALFCLASSCVEAKIIETRHIEDVIPLIDHETWFLVKDRPLAWMISINGFIADVTHLPLEIQEEAFRKGLIPYVPSKHQN